MRKVFKSFWVLLALAAAFFCYFLPNLSKYFRLKYHDERLTHEIADMQARVTDLKKEEQLIKNDPEHLEEVMRRELGLVNPGEVVYKLVPEEVKPPVKSDKPEANPNSTSAPQPAIPPAQKT